MNNQAQTQTQATSLLILQNKRRIQNTIDHYHRNLPPTYQETKRIITNETTLKDITHYEVKNSMFPEIGKSPVVVSSENGEIKKKGMYIIPDFIKVSHRKKMMERVFSAYTKYVSANKKERDIQLVHTKAINVALDEINSYIKWVESNNDKLVEKYPEMFSYRKDVVDNIPEPTEKPKDLSFVDKVKKLFYNGNKG